MARIRTLFSFLFVSAVAVPGFPCSVTSIPTPDDLVQKAQLIVRARAEGLSGNPGRMGTHGGSPTQVRFTVVEVLKGSYGGQPIEFDGGLGVNDDPNDRPVPYDFVRPGGRHGNCFALLYRQGAEYLLMLAHAGPSGSEQHLTPYWAALAATNEQVVGRDDPWVVWVRRQLASAGIKKPEG